MKKRLIIHLVLALLILFSLNLIFAQNYGNCTDGDYGLDYLINTTVIDEITGIEYHDKCIDRYTLREYYCERDGSIQTFIFDCENGCVNDTCLDNLCERDGYKCTTKKQGCGHYKQFNITCGIGQICCEDLPRCGDGYCYLLNGSSYSEDFDSCPQDCSPDYTIKVKGKLINAITKQPVSNVTIESKSKFSPSNVETDSNGEFYFEVNTSLELKTSDNQTESAEFIFKKDCYLQSSISFKRNYDEKKLALVKKSFDKQLVIKEILNQENITITELELYPASTLRIDSDIPVKSTIYFKSKVSGTELVLIKNNNLAVEDTIENILPVGYEVKIDLTESSGTTFSSNNYIIPKENTCQISKVKFTENQAHWYETTEIKPDSSTGPIKLKSDIDESDVNCVGCLSERICYPESARTKDDKFCKNNLLTIQYKTNNPCTQNYECESNNCKDNKCKSKSFFAAIASFFKKLF